MSAITPSVGRKVWFFRDDQQVEPIDATVVKVWASPEQAHPLTAVNLDCVDPLTGQHFFVPSVVASEEPVANQHYRWMPYQKQVAAKQ